MATINSKLAITGTPVWFITGCATGFGRELGGLGARELTNAKLVWKGA